jgi:hypothetical protein
VGSPGIDIWMERHIVPFKFIITKKEILLFLDIPLPYSIRPQFTEKFVHIPLTDGNWLCGTL